MKIKLSFNHPKSIPTNRDALEYIFPYYFVDINFIGMPEEISETKYYKIKVSITGTLQSMWQLSEDDLLKVLYEYIKRYLVERIKHDSIQDNEEYSLSTGSHPKKSPYDPTRIQYLDGVEFEYQERIIEPKAPKKKKVRAKPIKKAIIKRRGTIKQKTSKDVIDKINEINQYMKDKKFDLAKTKLLELEEQIHSEQFIELAAELYLWRIEDKLAKKSYSDARSIAREYIDFSYKVDEEKYSMDGLYYETVSLYGMGEKDISVTKMKHLISKANFKGDNDLLSKIRNWAEADDEKEKIEVLKFLNNVDRIQTEYVEKVRKHKDATVKDDIGTDPNLKLAYDSDILNDKYATGDLDLGYEVYVNAFVALIDKYGNEIAPLTIGIHGEWGSGKTSLMDAIRKKLISKKYVCIWFNAWKYIEEESIWRAFLRQSLLQVGKSLGKWKKFWYKLNLLRLNYFVVSIVVITVLFPVSYGVSQVMKWNYPVWLLMIGIIILLTLEMLSKLQAAGFDLGEKLTKKIGNDTSTDFMGDIEKDMQDFISIYSDINKKNKEKKPLIVFIDDLDRCPPERIVGVMNAINTITYLENSIFFLGYDTTIVGMAIGNHYSKVLGDSNENDNKENSQLDFGLDFLDKIVQIPFRLPRPGVTDLNKFIKKVLKVESASTSSEDGIIEDENKGSPNKVIKPVDGLKISDDIAITIEGPDRENLAAVTAEILESGVKEYGLSNIRKIKRFINTFRLLYEIGSESGLLTEYKISPQQLGYFLYFHLFNKRELEMQVSYMKNLSRLQLEIDETIQANEKPKNKVTDKLNIVFTDKDNSEIEKYRILDEFVRGSVN